MVACSVLWNDGFISSMKSKHTDRVTQNVCAGFRLRQSHNATARKGQWGLTKNVIVEIILQGYAWVDQSNNLPFQHIQLENLPGYLCKNTKTNYIVTLDFKVILWAYEMAQQVNIPAAHHDDLHSIPRDHTVEEKNRFLQLSFDLDT